MIKGISKKVTALLPLLTVGAMLLSACGADPTVTPAPVPTATTAPVAATATTAPAVPTDTAAPVAPTATTAAAATVATGGGGKIAILLPETKTARYESQDLPNFKAKLKALGFDVDNDLIYSNANQDASAQQQQAEAALTNGAKVLVLDPVDSASAAAIADAAKAKNVPVISYDRLILGTANVNYYLSFDNEQVGKLQGQSLLDALGGKTDASIVMINGAPTDNNAKLFKAGAHSVLDGKVTIAKEYDTPDWSPDKAQDEMTQALTALGNKVDGVLAANDGTGGGAIAAMKAAGITPLPPVTGQDAEVAGIQRIVAGEQYMTIYKAFKQEAETAAQLAYDLVNGTTPDASMVSSKVNNGTIDVPSILLAPIAVTKDKVASTVLADGFWTYDQICTADYVAACTAAGITAGGSTGTGSGSVPAGKIAILLPETKTARYESQDLPNFKAKLKALGFDVDNNLIYSNANQDASAQQQQAEAALTNGAKVLVLDPVDSASAAAIADAAKAKNVPVISYDRLILGTANVNYYLSFDNEQVGKLQGQSLLDALGGKTDASIVMINGAPTDNNAKLFKAGAHSVLDGKVTIAKEYDTPDWSPDKAQDEMTQALTALGNKVDGVLAANDGTGGGAIAAMKAAGITPLPPVTGQDAEVAGIQRIVAGEQYMTIYKAFKQEAETAAQLAFTLLGGGTPDASMVSSKVNNGTVDVPSVLLAPIAVTKDKVASTVLADGFWTYDQICTADYVAACTAAGITAGGSTGTGSGSVPAGKIAILLPETKTARYESQDLPNFKAKLKALGFDVDNNLIYSNANQDASAQQQQAEAALTNGAKVLVLDPVDSASAAAIADAAKAKGVPVISYDRLILGTANVNYYLSFDNEQVGKLQGQSLLNALGGKTDASIVMINGAPTDNNAKLFKAGAHSVLDGKVTIAKEYDTPDWSPDKAQDEMTQALTALGNKVDGVLAANDGTGGGAIAAMKAAGITPIPPVTGQDAEVAGIQRIIAGEQYMTIYKAFKQEAETAAQLAFTLLGGGTPDASMVASKVNNGTVDVPSVLLAPIAVTKDNVATTVIADGFWTAAQICTADYAAACTAAGIK